MHQSSLFAFGLIKNDECCDELTIDIQWAAIGPCLSPFGNNDWPEQSEIRLPIIGNMRVIPPNKRGRIGWPRAAFLIREPTVPEFSSWRNLGSSSWVRRIVRPFIIFVVAEPMRMHPE